MDNTNYNKRELDEKFREIADRFTTQDETLDRILTQTTKTNGKVAELSAWRQYITGGLGVLTVILVPVVIYLITHIGKH